MSPNQLRSTFKAHAAALRHGMPGRKMQIVAIYGRDGGALTIAYLASILRSLGQRVGIITHDYIEIAGERAKGSDQARPFDDSFRLNELLANMRGAKCGFVLMELPAVMPEHQFTGVPFNLLLVRRITDSFLDQVTAATAVSQLQGLIRRKNPDFVILPHDDAGFSDLHKLTRSETSLSFGTNEQAEAKIDRVQMHPKGCAVMLTIDHQTELELTSRLTGKQAVYSLTAAASAAYLLHVPLDVIEGGIAKLPHQPAQCEFLPVDRPYNVVIDGSITPQGIHETLESLKHFTKNRLIAVVSANLNQHNSWRSAVGEVVADLAGRVIVTDGDYSTEESPQAVRAQLLEGVVRTGSEASTDEVADRKAAIEKALSIARRSDTIVICASTTRPYRQVGNDHLPWSDKQVLEELI